MKIRQGFVSNSSSSSYTCNVCDFSEHAWEPPDEFYYCVKGHGLCMDCHRLNNDGLTEIANKSIDEICDILNLDPEQKWDKDSIEELQKEDEVGKIEIIHTIVIEDDLPSFFCPVCNFDVVITRDIKQYLLKETGITTEEVFRHIKEMNKRRKKLYDNEYVAYVCAKTGITTTDFTKEIKHKFSNYDEFQQYIRS
jgi:hypothetical protein